ncbi:MAG: GntR family transcriptional regulator [Oscillospiraceae bacterium]|nr:GntR family transcriptional regulator [Oscillospiraceae bacterium]
MITNRPTSLADQVFERLENDILSGVYAKGTVFTEQDICDDFGVSRTPVREALARLEQEHIIENNGKGLRVVGITVDDANIIYTIRQKVEGLAAAECARKATDEQVKELTDLVELQTFYAEKGDSEKVKQIDSEFHEKLYAYTGSFVYSDTLVPLHRKIQKYRKQTVEKGSSAKSSCAEHEKIIDAIAARDPDAAEAAMNEHISRAFARVRELDIN